MSEFRQLEPEPGRHQRQVDAYEVTVPPPCPGCLRRFAAETRARSDDDGDLIDQTIAWLDNYEEDARNLSMLVSYLYDRYGMVLMDASGQLIIDRSN